MLKKILPFLCLTMIGCDIQKSDVPATGPKSVTSENDSVLAAFQAIFTAINNANMSDSVSFNKYKALFNDDFTVMWDSGDSVLPKDTILQGWRGFLVGAKANFTPVIDRMDVSCDLAYIVYHYNERFSDLKTGKELINTMHSALAIFKKDKGGEWKEAFLY